MKYKNNSNFVLRFEGEHFNLYQSAVYERLYIVTDKYDKVLFEHSNTDKDWISYSSGILETKEDIKAFSEGAEMLLQIINE